MEILKCICLVCFAVSSVCGQSCTGVVEDCTFLNGFTSLPQDLWQICTLSIKQLLAAKECVERCNYPMPRDLTDTLKTVHDSCSARQGCQDFSEKFKVFKSYYLGESILLIRINNIISLFNSRRPNQDECRELRQMRTNIKSLTKACGYLDYFYQSYLLPIENFDKALYVCGAEEVETIKYPDRCSDQLYSSVESSCSVSCQLANAASAGEFCSILQSQSACIEAKTMNCLEARNSLLLPRIDTYSYVNQLFQCNITVLGVLAKPLDYLECSFKNVMFSCFNIERVDRITFRDVQQYVNRDFFPSQFCSNVNNKDHNVKKCFDAYNACMTPISRLFQKRKPLGSENFNPSLGTFPLNGWGVHQAYEACNLPPQYKPTMICQNPGYKVPRTTTIPPNFQV